VSPRLVDPQDCWKEPLEAPERSSKLTYLIRTGAWFIHPLLIFLLKILFDTFPRISQETSWTLTNITYMFGSYIMFHWVQGVPFEFNAGAYDNLNMWEQIDNGDQYTPAKKFLLSVPVVLFLLSTHYTHYDLWFFMVNLAACLGVVIPKLPSVSINRLFNSDPGSQADAHTQSHRMRVSMFSGKPEDRSG